MLQLTFYLQTRFYRSEVLRGLRQAVQNLQNEAHTGKSDFKSDLKKGWENKFVYRNFPTPKDGHYIVTQPCS